MLYGYGSIACGPSLPYMYKYTRDIMHLSMVSASPPPPPKKKNPGHMGDLTFIKSIAPHGWGLITGQFAAPFAVDHTQYQSVLVGQIPVPDWGGGGGGGGLHLPLIGAFLITT